MPTAMAMKEEALLELSAGKMQEGIFVTSERTEQTVWDRLAVEDARHAVISAGSEQAAWEKSAPQIEQIKARITPNTVLLDVGCGYGRIAQYLLADQQIGTYVGVDSSLTMLRIFQDRYRQSPAEQRTPAVFVNSDITRLPLTDASVDLAVVSAVFLHNHKSFVSQAMGEIERVLKPGGTLLVFSSFPRRATAMGLQGMLHQAYLNLRGDAKRNGPVRYFSRNEIAELLRGFSDCKILPTGFEIVPKSVIGLPAPIERGYRKFLSGPANTLLGKLVPNRWQPVFARHYDVIASK